MLAISCDSSMRALMGRGPEMEIKHEFILIFDGVPDLNPDVADALYEAGCDDGTFMMTSGRIYGAFTRAAPRMKDAVASAIRDVRNAKIGARFVRVQHDMVGTEIAHDAGELSAINSVIAFQAAIDLDPGLFSLINILTTPDRQGGLERNDESQCIPPLSSGP
jgi:hypothetical protein